MSDAFYGSNEWINGPRDAIPAFVDSHATVVIAVNEMTLRGLRLSRRGELRDGPPSRNDDDTASVRKGVVKHVSEGSPCPDRWSAALGPREGRARMALSPRWKVDLPAHGADGVTSSVSPVETPPFRGALRAGC